MTFGVRASRPHPPAVSAGGGANRDGAGRLVGAAETAALRFENTVIDLLHRGLDVRFRAKGASMHPTIRCGEPLYVEAVETADLRCGDVVLARHARGLTAHRIVRIDGARITTRGDNCAESDPGFGVENVLGRVRLVRARWWVRRALTNFSRYPKRLLTVATLLWQSVL